ncbi:hypothetical protein DPSP01_013664 [Paraphaeosphaeria sporulosa]
MYPSFEITEREAVPQDTPSQEHASLNMRHSSDQAAIERVQLLDQRWSRLRAIRLERSNSYHASKGFQAPSLMGSYSPYAIPSQEVIRRDNNMTSGYVTSSAPSTAVFPNAGIHEHGSPQPESSVSARMRIYYGSAASIPRPVTYPRLQTTKSAATRQTSVTNSVPSRSQSFCASAAPSASSYTVGRIPDSFQHAPSALSSIASVQTVRTPSTKSKLTAVTRLKLRRKEEKRISYSKQEVASSESILPISISPTPLTEVQKKINREIARTFVRNYEARPKEGRADRDVPVSMEWNPAQQGHKLIDLDIPMSMLLDCIFDARHLETEDITNVVADAGSDPLVELYRICCRVQFMEHARIHWKDLRSSEDAILRKHLDLLADLHTVSAIKPFPPLARFLDDWTEWRTCCELVGSTGQDEEGILGELAEEKLKELLKEKGFVGTWEREINKRLAAIEKQVVAVCKERANSSPFLLDVESLEILEAAHRG